MKPQRPFILSIIILSQFACTSTWFAGNAILESLSQKLDLQLAFLGWVLSSVQLGFIVGTLTFGLLMIADRFSPSKVFMICALFAAVSNLALILPSLSAFSILASRFATGFFLAGIYPVGMKIASDYYEKGLGQALGFLVGALVLGSAFPYLLKGTEWGEHPETVIQCSSLLTVIGGIIMFLFVPNGPYRVASSKIKLNALPLLFKNFRFKSATFGYFGHMWELYAFWAFTPVAILWYTKEWDSQLSPSLWTGIVIALGGLSCAVGGIISNRIGSRKVALWALSISGLFCLLSPFLFHLNTVLFLMAWCIWGIAVSADSPQLSQLIAASVSPELKGTALTFSTCFGFALTIASIQLLGMLQHRIPIAFLFVFLAIGPIAGFWQLIRLKTD